jgi:hypothetical protein
MKGYRYPETEKAWRAANKNRLAAYARTHYDKKHGLIQSFRNERGCEECGEKHPDTLDLHHVNSETKNPLLTKKTDGSRRPGGARLYRLSYDDLEVELQKCIVLCANCHRIIERKKQRAS